MVGPLRCLPMVLLLAYHLYGKVDILQALMRASMACERPHMQLQHPPREVREECLRLARQGQLQAVLYKLQLQAPL